MQPLYQELFDLHVDYSGRFQALYRAARKGEAIDTPPTEERQRFGMRHRQARASARAMLRRELPEAAAAFFEAVEGYFSYLPPDTSDTTTAERYVIRIVRATPKGCDPRIRWAYLIKDTIRELGSRWREVVETYAEARASLL